MRQHEDEDVGGERRVADVGHRHDVVRERPPGQILDVLVVGVDDLGQLAAVHILLEHPHVDVLDEPLGAPGGVHPDQAGDGGAPVAAAHDADLLRSHADHGSETSDAGVDMIVVSQVAARCFGEVAAERPCKI